MKLATAGVCSVPTREAVVNKLEDHGKVPKKKKKITEHLPREAPLEHSGEIMMKPSSQISFNNGWPLCYLGNHPLT